MSNPCTLAVLSHARPAETDDALRHLIALAAQEGAVVRLDRAESEKHPAIAPGPGVEIAEAHGKVDLAVALGGDGTILRALREFAGTGVPVFGVNFGEIGFLSTVDRDEGPSVFERALAGDFETLTLPAIELHQDGEKRLAVNDAAITRKVGERVANLAYAVSDQEVGSVRCDGLVVATPAGSTGYNLANGGPVMAWGVEGFAVSFIAPHSLTARALVVAPNDLLTVHNRSESPVDVHVDGRPVSELEPGATVRAGFVREATELALVPGSSFYKRLREKFGRLV